MHENIRCISATIHSSCICITVCMVIYLNVYAYMMNVLCGEFSLLFLSVKSLMWLLWDSSGLSTNSVVAF